MPVCRQIWNQDCFYFSDQSNLADLSSICRCLWWVLELDMFTLTIRTPVLPPIRAWLWYAQWRSIRHKGHRILRANHSSKQSFGSWCAVSISEWWPRQKQDIIMIMIMIMIIISITNHQSPITKHESPISHQSQSPPFIGTFPSLSLVLVKIVLAGKRSWARWGYQGVGLGVFWNSEPFEGSAWLSVTKYRSCGFVEC